MKWLLTVLLFSGYAFGQGLKTEDLGNRAPGSASGPQALSPEQLQKMVENGSAGGAGLGASPDDLKRLLKEIKLLNSTIEERNKALEKLMDETP